MSAAAPLAPAPVALTGAQRAAALLILLGEENGGPIWSQLDEQEVKSLSLAMAQLGSVPGGVVERLMQDFATALGSTGALIGSADRVESLLSKIFPAEKVAALMSEVRGRAGRDVWRRLSHVPAEALSRFLAGEYPQTIAVVVSRLGSEQGGRVLALLPDALAADTVARILSLGPISEQALSDIEDLLYREFFGSTVRRVERDRFEVMADRFNVFDRPTEERFMAALEEADGDAARQIRARMFTFEDLLKLDSAGCQTLLRGIDKEILARALKGAKEATRSFFLSNMSSRAAKNMRDDIDALGPLRMQEVAEAQTQLVQAAKALAESGEIRIAKGGDEELVV